MRQSGGFHRTSFLHFVPASAFRSLHSWVSLARLRKRPGLVILLWLVVGLVRPFVLPAQTTRPSLYDKFEANLSLTAVILNSNIRIDASNGEIGTDIDAEDDLGLAQTKLQPRGALRWRPGRRHELEAGYQFARRTSAKTLERTIDFGDSTYVVNTPVQSRLDTDQAFLIYRFAFLAKERTQVGVGLGLGALLVGTDLDALTDASGQPEVAFTQSKSATAPVGSLGIFGRFLAADRWYFEVDARYISVTIDRFDAQVIEAGAAVRYFLSSSVGLEAGYGGSGIRLDVGPKEMPTGTEGLASGRIKYSLQNLRLGVILVP